MSEERRGAHALDDTGTFERHAQDTLRYEAMGWKPGSTRQHVETTPVPDAAAAAVFGQPQLPRQDLARLEVPALINLNPVTKTLLLILIIGNLLLFPLFLIALIGVASAQ